MKLVLHNYWRSSASHRVRIGLALKGLAYEYVAVNIVKDGQHADAYRAKNPMAQVPTLEVTEDDGTVWTITQSLPILEYLDERWPAPWLLPPATADAIDPALQAKHARQMWWLRARARAMAEVINSGIQPLQNLSVTRAIKKLGADDAAWPRSFIATGLAAYEQLVRDTYAAAGDPDVEFSAGQAPTIADCCLIPQLASARRFGVDYSQHELLVRIEKHCLALPAFANAAPEQQPDAVRT